MTITENKCQALMEKGLDFYKLLNLDRNTIIRYGTTVNLQCSCCGGSFSTTLGRVLPTLESHYMPTNFICHKVSCRAWKKREIIAMQTRLGETPAQGHIVSDDQKRKQVGTMKSLGVFERLAEQKRGKTIDEMYGSEKASEIRRKMRENNSVINGSKPRAYYSPTPEVRAKIGKTLKDFFKSDEYRSQLVRINPLTGVPCTKAEYHGAIVKLKWNGKSNDKKSEITEKIIRKLFDRYDVIKHAHWGWHRAWYEETPSQPYRSEWERLYFESLDHDKVHYKSNKTIYIPYVISGNKPRYYIPDVLIYKSDWDLVEIQEIKPKIFLTDPVVQSKFHAAEEYCLERNIKFTVITETELNNRGIDLRKLARSQFKENKKKRIASMSQTMNLLFESETPQSSYQTAD
jgi:hypothetical protein